MTNHTFRQPVFNPPFLIDPIPPFVYLKSPYGAVFKLSTKIGSAPIVYTDFMTGDQILHCFGFDGSRYLEDLGILAAVGGCGLALAFVFLKRSR